MVIIAIQGTEAAVGISVFWEITLQSSVRTGEKYRPGIPNKYFMKKGVFWVVTPCGSCKNRRFGGTWRLLHQGDKSVN
jgi:hypothetical protein